MDTSDDQLVPPTEAAMILDLLDRLSTLEAKFVRLSSDLADSLSIRVATVQCERDVVPPLSLDVLTGPFAVGDTVVVRLGVGGYIDGRITAIIGDRFAVDGGRLGTHTVDPSQLLHCPADWLA